MKYIVENYATIITVLVALFPAIQIIVNLTPTEKDNSVFDVIKKIVSYIVPNLKSGGGVHEDNIVIKKK